MKNHTLAFAHLQEPQISDVYVLRFAKLFHKSLADFVNDSEKIFTSHCVSGLQYKFRTGRFLRYLNHSSYALQKIASDLKQQNALLYQKVAKLIQYLHAQIDELRLFCMKLLKSRLGLKHQYLGIMRKARKSVSLS